MTDDRDVTEKSGPAVPENFFSLFFSFLFSVEPNYIFQMGSSSSKPAEGSKPGEGEAPAKGQLINTQDIKKASAYLVKGGKEGEVTAKDFEKIFELQAKATGLMNQNETFQQLKETAVAKYGRETMRSLLDVDGDGKITPKDFELYFERYQDFLDRNSSQFDPYFPFIGQCLFGIGVGYFCGYVARTLYSYKIPIVVLSSAGYFGLQYAAQQQFINKEILLEASRERVKQFLDVNRDGELNKADIEQFVQDRFNIIATKLGPGGFAPGAMGGLTFIFGMWRGLRPRRV
jgi:hypothetical protein